MAIKSVKVAALQCILRSLFAVLPEKGAHAPFLLLAMGVKCNYLLFGKFNTETDGRAGAKARRAATPN